MGCVSSNLLSHEDDFSQLGSTALSHHIVSLTSSTYGLLSLDPSPHTPNPTTPPTPPRFTLGSIFPCSLSESKSLWSEPRPLRSDPEVINSWELMDGLDTADSFRFSPLPPSKAIVFKEPITADKENSHPNRTVTHINGSSRILKSQKDNFLRPFSGKKQNVLDQFEKLCPPNGENRLVIYTTTLRGVRKTFEACNAVRAAILSTGAVFCERDVSMDRGFREQLWGLMKGKDREAIVPPRVFVKGRYVGGAEELLKIVEEGLLNDLFEGIPKRRIGSVCEGCGDARFLPCFQCNGSCKIVMVTKDELGQRLGTTMVVRCLDCNENGLVLCPICC